MTWRIQVFILSSCRFNVRKLNSIETEIKIKYKRLFVQNGNLLNLFLLNID